MTDIEKLKSTLRRNIKLHDKLRDILREECEYIESDSLECLPGMISQKKEIEQEIEVTNRRITDMFDYYYSYGSLIDKNSNSEIGVLVDKLRESIHATASVISEAVGAVKKSKKEIVNNMRNLDNGKAAIHSYAKTRFI